MVIFLFDGSFQGLLTAVFESYTQRQSNLMLIREAAYQPGFLDTTIKIEADSGKADRVWAGLGAKIGPALRHTFFTVFLSESDAAYQEMFYYARYIFDNGGPRKGDYGNQHVLAISSYAKQVSRERHRMKAFVRFSKSGGGLYLATVEPDFNVLPLIAKHFADRYQDQRWLIFDKKRKYGIYYDQVSVQEVRLDSTPRPHSEVALPGEVLTDETDPLYTALWQAYFKSTNIKERANMKLHIQHVPKRYWKYLPEKQPEVSDQ